jgi:hypothetical protein
MEHICPTLLHCTVDVELGSVLGWGARKPVSPAVAVRLGKLFSDGAGVWVRMQGAYDTWHAERDEDVSGIPTLRPRAA